MPPASVAIAGTIQVSLYRHSVIAGAIAAYYLNPHLHKGSASLDNLRLACLHKVTQNENRQYQRQYDQHNCLHFRYDLVSR